MVPWSRPEPFGAWVRLDDATLVAIDRSLSKRLGVPSGFPLGRATRPLELSLAVTARCPAPCTGCYLDTRPDGHAPPRDELFTRIAEARELGVSTVAFGGGEPLTRDDLGDLAREARRLGLVPVMTTSGIGLTEARVSDLQAFAQINVSHDGIQGGYSLVRGFEGAAVAERAIGMLAKAGIAVGVNLVLTRDTFQGVESTAARIAELGARELQLLRYKPAGRADDPSYEARRLTDTQVDELFALVERLAARGDLSIRIDCSMVALLSEAILAKVPNPKSLLERFGVFGCEAGRYLGSRAIDGRIAPCSFLPAEPGAWDDAGAAIRAYHAALPEPCASCPIRSVCRGGCQVVSQHAGKAFAPDPECPRVRNHAKQEP